MSSRVASDGVCRVEFEPLGRRVDVPPGTSLLAAARHGGVDIASVCGGEGTCGRCRVVVTSGTVSPPQTAERRFLSPLELDGGQRLACRARVHGDVTVDVPTVSLATDQRLEIAGLERALDVDPAVRSFAVDAPPPSLADARSDLERVSASLERAHGLGDLEADPAVVRQLSPAARAGDWTVDAFVRGASLVGIVPRGRAPVGYAVDLGTTKIAGYLVDLRTGEELASGGMLNPQIGFGEDVISRLAYVARRADGADQLGRVVRSAVADLLGELAADAGVSLEQVADACVVGNTAMHHLFLGLPTRQLARAPFVAAASAPIDVAAREVDLPLAAGAAVHLPPGIGGFVGSDHVAVIVAADLDQSGSTAIGVDIGTNTEIVLAHPGSASLTSASCASGPAFEGAHIRDGMRAATGAIEAVRLTPAGPVSRTIGDAPPVGICGSGIVDVVAELHRIGAINDRGRFARPRPGFVREGDREPELVLVPASESGTGRDIVVGQSDVDEVQLAKGAIGAGIELLLEATGTPRAAVDELVVAGAFGSHLNLESALAIGLLPRLPNARVRQVGNAAGVGAKAMLLSMRERSRARQVARRTSYLELTTLGSFHRAFARAMSFGSDRLEPSSGLR